MNRAMRRAGRALARSTRKEWHPFERLDTDPEWCEQNGAHLAELVANTGDVVELWRNNVYAVQVYARARSGRRPAMQLAICRHDGAEVRGWSDLQRIKNELCGPEVAAVEIYPPASELVDEANMRHLFVLPVGEPAPFTIVGKWR